MFSKHVRSIDIVLMARISKYFLYAVIIIFLIKVCICEKLKRTCGRRLVHHETLITNGYPSKEGDWPWHAAILHIGVKQDIAYKCGGTVMNSNSILTAAHCVFENNRPIIPDRVLVELGKYNLKLHTQNTQEFEVIYLFNRV